MMGRWQLFAQDHLLTRSFSQPRKFVNSRVVVSEGFSAYLEPSQAVASSIAHSRVSPVPLVQQVPCPPRLLTLCTIASLAGPTRCRTSKSGFRRRVAS